MTNGNTTFEKKYHKNSFPILNNLPNTLGYIWVTHSDGSKSKLYYETYVGYFEGVLYKGNTIFPSWPTAYHKGFCEPVGDTVFSVSLEGHYFRYAHGLGLVTTGTQGLYSSTISLIGYIKNGDTTGVTITGVPSIKKFFEIKIYPNPTHNLINITTEKLNGTSILELYDLRGRLIVTKTFERDLSFDVSTYQQGIYFAIIKTEDGAVLAREKVVIQ